MLLLKAMGIVADGVDSEEQETEKGVQKQAEGLVGGGG